MVEMRQIKKHAIQILNWVKRTRAEEMTDTSIEIQQLMKVLEVQANLTSSSKGWLMCFPAAVDKCLQTQTPLTNDLSSPMAFRTKSPKLMRMSMTTTRKHISHVT
jgi:predicted ATP-dependent protease